MLLRVNGKPPQDYAASTAAELLTALNLPRERVAVMINDQVIRRAELENAALNEGDNVEVITMVGGG